MTTMTTSRTINETAVTLPGRSGSPKAVQVKNLSAGYGTLEILHSVSFDVPAGETLVVLGESGCGKTTLLRVLAGLMPISNGEIWLDRQQISPLAPS